MDGHRVVRIVVAVVCVQHHVSSLRFYFPVYLMVVPLFIFLSMLLEWYCANTRRHTQTHTGCYQWQQYTTNRLLLSTHEMAINTSFSENKFYCVSAYGDIWRHQQYRPRKFAPNSTCPFHIRSNPKNPLVKLKDSSAQRELQKYTHMNEYILPIYIDTYMYL